MVTRPAPQAGPLVELLESRGATVLRAPTIELTEAAAGPLVRAAGELASGLFEWALFTSRNAVEAVFRRVEGEGRQRPRVRARVAAIGEATARALRDRGVEPNLVPDSYTTSALSAAMPKGTGRVLLARADIAPEGLEGALAGKGWTPVRVDAYSTRFPATMPAAARRALEGGQVDVVTFTSASTVEGFARLAGEARGAKVVCIGPVTALAAEAAGLHVDAVAHPHTIEGLVSAVDGAVGRRIE